jgi:hypothetical protein
MEVHVSKLYIVFRPNSSQHATDEYGISLPLSDSEDYDINNQL